MFSSSGKAIHPTYLTFLSQLAIDAGVPKKLKLERSFAAVRIQDKYQKNQ